MEGQRKALIIGVNHCDNNIGQTLRYAENDARSIYDVLTDRYIGTFDQGDVELLAGDAATWRLIKQRLRRIAVTSQPSDVLLVYFAGHAFIPEWGRQSDTYLATSDLDAGAVRDEPDNGLRMTFLRRDVFETFAGTSFLILDCCQAGTYVNSGSPGFDATVAYGSQIDRHSALLSCPADEGSRESSETQHGLLTYHLLRALQGEAADVDGRVNFAQMANFATEQNLTPTPGQLVQMWGPTCVLTDQRAGRRRRAQLPDQPHPIATITACENPLERCASSIAQLLGRVFRPATPIPRQSSFASGSDRFDIVRTALEADAVAVVEFGAHGLTVVDSTARFNREQLSPVLEQSRSFAFPNRMVWAGHVSSEETGHRVLCVPLAHDGVRSLVLVVVEPALSLLEMGEPLAVLLNAIWKSDVIEDPVHAEINVLTALRSAYGRLPASLYEHCFALYKDVISSFTIVFQPVVFLDKNPNRVGIESYEALARRIETDTRAPVAMLQTAHVWGDRFVVERDSLLFAKAVATYANADGHPSRDILKPVSVNVAVRSVMSDSYVGVVRSAIDDAGLDPRKVTLEISEQDAIQPRVDEVWTEEPLAFFHSRLTKLAREIEVGFAVDDFGVGYSSLARMTELTLTQIKVDRAILRHPLVLEELDLVMRIASYARDLGRAPAARTVVVEGFDDDSPVTLGQLYDHKIRYVQGYISGTQASASLHKLDDDVCRRIAGALTKGEDEDSPAQASAGSHR